LNYKVKWNEKVVDDLKNIDKKQAGKIIDKINNYLIKEPVSLGKPLKGMFKGMYRFRIGDFRVIYTINKEEKEINIMVIGHRKKIYKR
jgi:mRNA interferase RelE/StbE